MPDISMLDCIKRTPQLLDAICENRENTFAALFEALGDTVQTLEEIVFIGSGTSNTASDTSRFFVEKVTGIKTTSVYPDDFCYNTHAYHPKALYVFTSQTGTSAIVRKAQQKIRDMGFAAVCISESDQTPLAQETKIFVSMGCGKEEYPMRTIGYSTSVFTQMLMGLEIAKRLNTISADEYADYIAMASAVSESQRKVIDAAVPWLDRVKRSMLRSQCLIFVGSGALQGVAKEAAVKVWETPQIISMGYELEESLHGPNFGYNHNHCVIVLNNGGREDLKACSLARWMKDAYHNGFMIGSSVADDQDLQFPCTAGDFACLEIAPAVQVLAWKLAQDQGRDLFAPHDNSVMNRYFTTHDDNPSQ